jgi:hypothetical protein
MVRRNQASATSSTRCYTRVAANLIAATPSPFDRLSLEVFPPD